MSTARCAWLIGLLASVSVLGGCLSPAPIVPVSANDPAPLQAIRARFEHIVDAAHTDPNTNWHSSWTGNMMVNAFKKNHRGLCYQWQDYVYRGVAPTVERVGWACTGLVANSGNPFEHHVVLAWDPKVIAKEEILTRPAPPRRPVYVLDAWYNGRANVHWLDEWLENEKPHKVPAQLQDLPAEYEDPSGAYEFAVPEPNAGERRMK